MKNLFKKLITIVLSAGTVVSVSAMGAACGDGGSGSGGGGFEVPSIPSGVSLSVVSDANFDETVKKIWKDVNDSDSFIIKQYYKSYEGSNTNYNYDATHVLHEESIREGEKSDTVRYFNRNKNMASYSSNLSYREKRLRTGFAAAGTGMEDVNTDVTQKTQTRARLCDGLYEAVGDSTRIENGVSYHPDPYLIEYGRTDRTLMNYEFFSRVQMYCGYENYFNRFAEDHNNYLYFKNNPEHGVYLPDNGWEMGVPEEFSNIKHVCTFRYSNGKAYFDYSVEYTYNTHTRISNKYVCYIDAKVNQSAGDFGSALKTSANSNGGLYLDCDMAKLKNDVAAGRETYISIAGNGSMDNFRYEGDGSGKIYARVEAVDIDTIGKYGRLSLEVRDKKVIIPSGFRAMLVSAVGAAGDGYTGSYVVSFYASARRDRSPSELNSSVVITL